MRSLLRVAVIAVLIVIVAPLATTKPAHASAAAHGVVQGHGGVQLVIDSVTPQYARSDSTVTVSGTITNGTAATQAGLAIQLYSSPTWFTTRSDMESFADGAASVPLSAVGNTDVLAASIRAGGTISWRAKFSAADVGMSQFGVYPLEAQLTDLAGVPASSERTLLPYLPDNTSAISKL
ncbi:MAG: DUF6049 family protein, partial [Candidatus Angelobacter sp.]